MAEEYAGRKQLHLIWSTNSTEDYFSDRIEQLAEQNVQINIKQHRFRKEELTNILTKSEIATGSFFIVGSAPIVLQVRKNLRKLGIQEDQLHDEHLTM